MKTFLSALSALAIVLTGASTKADAGVRDWAVRKAVQKVAEKLGAKASVLA